MPIPYKDQTSTLTNGEVDDIKLKLDVACRLNMMLTAQVEKMRGALMLLADHVPTFHELDLCGNEWVYAPKIHARVMRVLRAALSSSPTISPTRSDSSLIDAPASGTATEPEVKP